MAAFVLVVGGCGGGSGSGSSSVGSGVGPGRPSSTSSTAVPTSAAPGTTTRGRSTTTTGHAAAPATTAAPPDDGATRPGSGDVQPTATDDGSHGPPGAYARTLLRPSPATAIVLERFAQDGATVAESSVSRSAGVVGDVAGKPVDVRPVKALAGGARSWTADEIRAAADAASAVPSTSSRAVIHVLQLRGTFEGSDQVLGVAVRGDVLALFPDSIEASATPLVSSESVEDAVVLHELGHLLGLVDLARDTGRADPDHPGHSKNTRSVMYWAVESSLVGQVLNGPPPRDFDSDDLADLRALRGGA